MSYPILFNTTEAARAAAIAGIAVAGITIVGDANGSAASAVAPSSLDLTTQGSGTLSDAISCVVTEKRNGSYELEMQYPMRGIHFSEMELRSLILAKPNYTDDPQLFRIYKITKPLNGICTVYAEHISYDMSGYPIPAGVTATSLTSALAVLENRVSAYGFTIAATRTAAGDFKTDAPASVRSWLGGKAGSILDLYGGEWHFDNFAAVLATARGTDRGVTIRYGKNLTELTQESTSANLYTAVQCYYKDSDGNIIAGSNVSTGITLDTPRVMIVDASQQFDRDNIPTSAQLDAYAATYIQQNNLATPAVNIELDFVQLQGLSERVDLCDTVHIYFETLGVNATAKCIEAAWDVLKERYTKCIFGTAKNSIANTINGFIESANSSMDYLHNEIGKTYSDLETAITVATEAITGNSGGYVVLHDKNSDGKPDEILIMDTTDITTAVKVWRWNENGLGYSSTGYGGTYATAITADGKIVADFILTGTMLANRIKGGTLTLGESNNDSGVLKIYDASNNLIGKWDKDGIVITKGSLDIGNGNFAVTSAGKATLKNGSIQFNASSGAYLTLQGNSIDGGYSGTSADGNGWLDFANRLSGIQCATLGDDTRLRLDAPYIFFGHSSGTTWRALVTIATSLSSTYPNYGSMTVQGMLNAYNLSVTGSKSRVVDTEDYAKRLLYCYETPSPMFGDVGEGTIGDDGKCYVWLDSIFAETIDRNQYQVFLQKYGNGDCYISERKANYFVVEGTPDLTFGWELKAKQADFSQLRLEKMIYDGPETDADYGGLAIDYIKTLKEERLAS